MRFNWYPDAYFFLRSVVVFAVLVATNAVDYSCEEQQQMFSQVLCILRIMSFLLTPSCCPQVPSVL
jgi:hypothetical protein